MKVYIAIILSAALAVTIHLSIRIGISYSDTQWRKKLIDSDIAQYHPKTGEWYMRSMTEIVDTGLILGKGTPTKVDQKN
jgi:hypothetical protein